MTEEAAIVLAAILLDLWLGDPGALPHPVTGIGWIISNLERLLRPLPCPEKLSGALLLLLTVGSVYLGSLALLAGAYQINRYLGAALATYLAWTCLAARSLHLQSRHVATALGQGDLVTARKRLSFIVGRDTDKLDEQQIWRATVETVAENSSDGVIAPLFYLLIGGPPLAMAYKAVNTLDSMVGYRNDRYIHFGWASARCDDLVNLVPARLTGVLMVLVAPFAGLSARGAWRVMRRDGRNHSSPNSGFPEAAAAGALQVQLGGSNSYGGRIVVKPAIGDPDHPLSADSYQGVVRLMYGSLLLMVGVWLAVKLALC
jgi:adenosylcobinamide-phosphate synthase